jgi:putative PIN family toxin of toxin-antitoxin system
LKVVFDTNIYISATLSKGKPYQALELAEEGKFDLYVSSFILREIEDVLGKDRIPFEDRQIDLFVGKIMDISEEVSPSWVPEAIQEDPSDNEIFACALEADAEYIVSGDRHLLKLGKYEGIDVVEVEEILRILE